jgi:peptidoglycan hydrolase-like protein with peptidoglycan-binding domain
VTRRRAIALAVAAVIVVGGVAMLRARGRSGHAAPAAAAYRTAAVTRTDLRATAVFTGTLTFPSTQPVVIRRHGIYTALPAPGTTVSEGAALAGVDGRPVTLLLGAVPAWRSLEAGVPDGPDVEQLETALVELGIAPDLTADMHFGARTTAAVAAWQRSLGVPVTGAIAAGDVVFLPAAVRVGAWRAALGGPAGGDSPYDATSPAEVVRLDLPAARQQAVTVGASVTVTLPGGATAAATVADVGRVVTVPTDTGGQGTPQPTVTVIIALSNPAAAGGLDHVPVTIEIVTQARSGVLAVPVTALLALAEGGYGVETIDASGVHHIVAVTPGQYAGGNVELTGSAPAEGTTVVVAR